MPERADTLEAIGLIMFAPPLYSMVKKSGSDPSLWLRGDDLDAGEGAKLLSPYSQSAWVYIAVSVLAENVAQIPFRISKIPATAAPLLGGASGGLRSHSPAHSLTPSPILRRVLGENIIESGPVVELF